MATALSRRFGADPAGRNPPDREPRLSRNARPAGRPASLNRFLPLRISPSRHTAGSCCHITVSPARQAAYCDVMVDNAFRANCFNVQFVIRLLLLLSCLPGEFVLAQTTPAAITLQPRSQSVSLGANVTFRVTATGTPPLSFQWRWNEIPVDGATISTLALTNVTLTRAGAYFAIVSNAGGAVTSAVAVLTVDPTFTKITTGLIATDGGDSSGCAWG